MNQLKVYIGRNPSVPLEISLTLNKYAEIKLEIEAEYPSRSIEQEIDGNFYSINHLRSVHKNYTDE
jgi:hypothetical protein